MGPLLCPAQPDADDRERGVRVPDRRERRRQDHAVQAAAVAGAADRGRRRGRRAQPGAAGAARRPGLSPDGRVRVPGLQAHPHQDGLRQRVLCPAGAGGAGRSTAAHLSGPQGWACSTDCSPIARSCRAASSSGSPSRARSSTIRSWSWPTSRPAISIPSSIEIMKLFREINTAGTTVLVATHNPELIRSSAGAVSTSSTGVSIRARGRCERARLRVPGGARAWSGRARRAHVGGHHRDRSGLGGFLMVTTNLQRYVQQWMESAELSVFLRDDIGEQEREAVRARLADDAAYCASTTSPRTPRSSGFGGFPGVGRRLLEYRRQPVPGVVRGAPPAGPAWPTMRRPFRGRSCRSTAWPMCSSIGSGWNVLSLIAGVRMAGLAVTVVLLLGAAFTVTAVVRLAPRTPMSWTSCSSSALRWPSSAVRRRGAAARGNGRPWPSDARGGVPRPDLARPRSRRPARRPVHRLPGCVRPAPAHDRGPGRGAWWLLGGLTRRPLTIVEHLL